MQILLLLKISLYIFLIINIILMDIKKNYYDYEFTGLINIDPNLAYSLEDIKIIILNVLHLLLNIDIFLEPFMKNKLQM